MSREALRETGSSCEIGFRCDVPTDDRRRWYARAIGRLTESPHWGSYVECTGGVGEISPLNG
jgi:hypothetical protein